MSNTDRRLNWRHTVSIGPLDVDFSQGLVMKPDGNFAKLSEYELDLLIALDPHKPNSKVDIAKMAKIEQKQVANAMRNLKTKLRTSKTPVIVSSHLKYKISGNIELD